MRPVLVTLAASALIAALAGGCGHVEQTRRTQDYERFLKDTLGTVAPDAAAGPAHAAH